MFDHAVDVTRLGEAHDVTHALDLDVKKVLNLAFVLDVPALLERLRELMVEGMLVVVGLGQEEVVHVAP